VVAFQVEALGFRSQLADLVQMRPDHVDLVLQPVDAGGVLVVGGDAVTVGAVTEVDDRVGFYVFDDREQDVERVLRVVGEMGVTVDDRPPRGADLALGWPREGYCEGSWVQIQDMAEVGSLDSGPDDGSRELRLVFVPGPVVLGLANREAESPGSFADSDFGDEALELGPAFFPLFRRFARDRPSAYLRSSFPATIPPSTQGR
jgi:hypothetical protein